MVLTIVITLSSITVKSDGNEYSIKAMFVLNFIKYIEWPGGNTSNYFRIGVIGKSEMLDALKGMTANRNEMKQIIIEQVSDQSKEGFRIIFVSKECNGKLEEILKKYRNKGVLLISDEYKGKFPGGINLLNINNKIRFEINTSQAHECGVKISSKLNELAVAVNP
jgi:hypothetical protein